MLRQIATDPYLSRYDVILVDEVHERHITGDFLLAILKRLIAVRKDIKIILMSATINTKLFQEYFKAPILTIPGRAFPVRIEYIPLENDDRRRGQETRGNETRSILNQSKGERIKPEPYVKILERIDESVSSDERGDLLIFVSGMNEISTLADELEAYATFTRRWIILRLHSSLSVADQETVFDIAPDGVRKCIIATNIAETSVTIDQIRFIVDSGKVKEIGHDFIAGFSRLSEFWISKSSATQRTGRAGRTGPGECYRMYSRSDFESFNEFPIPEILRIPLESIILELACLNLGSPKEFDFIERPSDDSVLKSIERLSDIGCLDENECITDLGRIISSLPLDIHLAKMLVYGNVPYL